MKNPGNPETGEEHVVRVYIEPRNGGSPGFYGGKLGLGSTVTFHSDAGGEVEFPNGSPFDEESFYVERSDPKVKRVSNVGHFPFNFKNGGHNRVVSNLIELPFEPSMEIEFYLEQSRTRLLVAAGSISVEVHNKSGAPFMLAASCCSVPLILEDHGRITFANISQPLRLSQWLLGQPGGGDIIDIDPSCCDGSCDSDKLPKGPRS